MISIIKMIFWSMIIAIICVMDKNFLRIKACARCRIWIGILAAMLLPSGIVKISLNQYIKSASLLTAQTLDNQYIPVSFNHEASVSITTILLLIWAVVAFIIICSNIVTTIVITHQLKKSEKSNFKEYTYFISARIDSPVSFGIIHNNIVLPNKLYSNEHLDYILLHESIHFKSHDMLKRIFVNIACALMWFDPLVWILRKKICRDMEMACDDLVVKDLDAKKRLVYGELLFGEATASFENKLAMNFSTKGNLRVRIVNIVDKPSRKKGYVWIILICIFGIAGIFGWQKKIVTANSDLIVNESDSVGLEKMIWPLDNKYTTITSDFGKRYNPKDQNSYSFHSGIDIYENDIEGSPIYAVLSGKVTATGYSDTHGFYIEITHNNGITTRYMNCSIISAASDSNVEQGCIIGYVGNTSIYSTAPHLHFEVIQNGNYIDPLIYF